MTFSQILYFSHHNVRLSLNPIYSLVFALKTSLFLFFGKISFFLHKKFSFLSYSSNYDVIYDKLFLSVHFVSFFYVSFCCCASCFCILARSTFIHFRVFIWMCFYILFFSKKNYSIFFLTFHCFVYIVVMQNEHLYAYHILDLQIKINFIYFNRFLIIQELNLP